MTTNGTGELAAAAAGGDVVYRGRQDSPSAACVVTLESGGRTLGALTHVVRHSPSGFSWGYGGSGPAELARCLLLDALGPDGASCPECHGGGAVVFDFEADTFVPAPAGREAPDGRAGAGRAGEHPVGEHPSGEVTEPTTCPSCSGDGFRLLPYQDFKWDYVAGFGREWRMTRAEILTWLASQPELVRR